MTPGTGRRWQVAWQTRAAGWRSCNLLRFQKSLPSIVKCCFATHQVAVEDDIVVQVVKALTSVVKVLD